MSDSAKEEPLSNDKRRLYVIVAIKAVVVAVILLTLWALEGKNSAPVYMKF